MEVEFVEPVRRSAVGLSSRQRKRREKSGAVEREEPSCEEARRRGGRRDGRSDKRETDGCETIRKRERANGSSSDSRSVVDVEPAKLDESAYCTN